MRREPDTGIPYFTEFGQRRDVHPLLELAAKMLWEGSGAKDVVAISRALTGDRSAAPPPGTMVGASRFNFGKGYGMGPLEGNSSFAPIPASPFERPAWLGELVNDVGGRRIGSAPPRASARDALNQPYGRSTWGEMIDKPRMRRLRDEMATRSTLIPRKHPDYNQQADLNVAVPPEELLELKRRLFQTLRS